jgi:hypothetical protein
MTLDTPLFPKSPIRMNNRVLVKMTFLNVIRHFAKFKDFTCKKLQVEKGGATHGTKKNKR